MLLPWISIATLNSAFYMRLTRNEVLEVFGEDYIRTARAKGLRERTVVIKHGLRAGLTPIVTAAGLDLAYLLGGAIITENIFNLPGLGSLAIGSVIASDLPLISGITLIAATLIEGVSLSLERGSTLAVVGESGSGKSVTAQAIMGLVRSMGGHVSGEIWLDGQELNGLQPEEVQALRGSEMAMIFQDPMSSLHPFYRVGDQIIEAILAHRKIGKAAARKEN